MSTATIERPAAKAPTTVSYRQTAKGEWVVTGPVDLVVEGHVTVTKKDGKTRVENVLGLGELFTVAGVRCRYGYLKPKNEEPTAVKPKPTLAQSSTEHAGNFVPDEFDDDFDGGVDEGVDEDEYRTRVDELGRTVPYDF